jgi:hypothetical protein
VLERPGGGEEERERGGWLGDPWVAIIGSGEDTGGAAGERKACHQRRWYRS